MGLDMYLTKRCYVKNWDHMKQEERHTVTVEKNGKPVISRMPIKEVSYDAGYWRKANAIHQWFVDNVQGGDDDCRENYVSVEHLQALLKIVNTILVASELVDANGEVVIKDPKIAAELLPTQSGFFFGTTQYDEYYYNNLVHTKEIIETALDENDGDYYYRSSW